MKQFKVFKTTDSELEGIRCDVCRTYYNDVFELQEFFSVNDVGGYYSILGDGTKIMIDVCQYCFKEKFGEFINTIHDFDDFNIV